MLFPSFISRRRLHLENNPRLAPRASCEYGPSLTRAQNLELALQVDAIRSNVHDTVLRMTDPPELLFGKLLIVHGYPNIIAQYQVLPSAIIECRC